MSIREFRIEKWNQFVESEGWQYLCKRIEVEMVKNINGVRSTAKVTGKEKECAGYCGAADAFELVMRLPDLIRKDLVAKGEKENG